MTATNPSRLELSKLSTFHVDFLDDAVTNALLQSANLVLQRCIDQEAFRKTVWPALDSVGGKIDPQLRLVPLDRIGSAQGASGSRVLIAYFFEASPNEPRPSPPLVVKIAPQPANESDEQNKLQQEAENAKATKKFTNTPERFAYPIHLDKVEASGTWYRLLWAPFTSVWETANPAQLSIQANELLNLLREPPVSREVNLITRVLSETFDLLKPVHARNGSVFRQERQILEEYDWYLRSITGDAGAVWKQNWGDPGNRLTLYEGKEFANPFWILETLKSARQIAMCCGAAHGDLHPRNIVLDKDKRPCIIDFGWAGDNRHIAKDFVLMECNLRFMVLRPAVALEGAQRLAQWIRFEEAWTACDDLYCDTQATFIGCVRSAAKSHMPRCSDWDLEYVLPTFLTALGLIKHLDRCDNQSAAVRAVLHLANYVRDTILPKIKP